MLEQFPKRVINNESIDFSVERFGLYCLSLTARCKANEKLHLQIDDLVLREIPPIKNAQYDTIPPAWNGTELKGLEKTVIFILAFEQGKHTLKFVTETGAEVEKCELRPISNFQNIQFDFSNPAENGNGRPWYVFALVNLPLISVTADAGVWWHLWDGDDVKLIIDGVIEQDKTSKKWLDWIWSARWWQFFGEKREQKTFTRNLPVGIHYIEFWADKTPLLYQVHLDLGSDLHVDPIPVKRVSTVDYPKWTGNFADDTDEILLARLILGEAETQSREARIWIACSVLNRVHAKAWPDTIHEVILQPHQYSPFVITDKTYPKIIDPLGENTSKLRLKNWKECYQIARDIISGKIVNPTTATHFIGIGVKPEDFVKKNIPQGKFLKQIDDTLFFWSPN